MKKTYKIEVDCANCANKMEETTKKTAGVKDAVVNFMAQKLIVEFEDGANEAEVMKALRWGATGIMLDGSAHSFEENVALTKHIVDTCAAIGIGVEGELGHVGSVNDDAMEEYKKVKKRI